MANLLDQLAAMTVVVADTGDIDAIKQFTPRDATTNPSLILAATQIPTYQNLIDRSLQESRQAMGPGARGAVRLAGPRNRVRLAGFGGLGEARLRLQGAGWGGLRPA